MNACWEVNNSRYFIIYVVSYQLLLQDAEEENVNEEVGVNGEKSE